MVEPKTYRVKQSVKDRDFMSNNFRVTQTQYILNKPLYTEEIILNLTLYQRMYDMQMVRYLHHSIIQTIEVIINSTKK